MYNGILSNAQGSDYNINLSLWQWIFTKVKTPYDIAAPLKGINTGVQTNRDGTFVQDNLGLGIIQCDGGNLDNPDVFKRLPTVAYCLDDGRGVAEPKATGIGDGANIECRSIGIRCVPAVKVASDNTLSADENAIALLKTTVWNAFGRSLIIPIVDSTQTPVNGLYPQIGYAEILRPTLPRRPRFKDSLIVDRRDFDLTLELRLQVQTYDGL